MPKFYCEYCGIYLTHSSPSGRKQHSHGRKHINNKVDYYSQFMLEHSQNLQQKMAMGQNPLLKNPMTGPPLLVPRPLSQMANQPPQMGGMPGMTGMPVMSGMMPGMPQGMPGGMPPPMGMMQGGGMMHPGGMGAPPMPMQMPLQNNPMQQMQNMPMQQM